MTPRTILILALGALVCVIAVLTEPSRPADQARKDTDIIISGNKFYTTNGEPLTPMFTNVPQTLPEWEAQLIAGGYTPEQARKTTLLLATGLVNLANAHRTNRTMPGVRATVNTNRFPILEP